MTGPGQASADLTEAASASAATTSSADSLTEATEPKPTAAEPKPAPPDPKPTPPDPKPTAAETARSVVQEALELPKAVEDTAAFVPRPGSPAAEPAVQAARQEAEAARAALGIEIARLRQAGRDAVDVKAKVKRMPAAIAEDPRKFVGVGAAGAGVGLLVSQLRRGRRKAMPPGLLPPEVESALVGIGPDGEKVRDALNESFTRYLEASGAQTASRRRKVQGLIPLFVLPVASTAAREAIKRFATGGPRKPGAA